MPTMKRLLLIGLVGVALLTAGCVQRTINITSNPEGALVYLNDEEVGRTPCKVPFTFYGVYDVRLQKAGYQTLSTEHKAVAPGHDRIGMDLINELVPWTSHVILNWHFELEELVPVDEVLTVDRARQLRAMLDRAEPDATPKP
jgi:hypothetical protein